MKKYAPLHDYLVDQGRDELVLTFDDIERILDAPPPPSASEPYWLANVRSHRLGRVQREAWRAAGYNAYLLNGTNKVRFCRVS